VILAISYDQLRLHLQNSLAGPWYRVKQLGVDVTNVT
jgi:hypothetical protein